MGYDWSPRRGAHDKMTNRIIITGTRTAEEVIREHLAREQERRTSGAGRTHPPPPPPPRGTNPPPTATTLTDFITLSPLRCVDADGKVFEEYQSLAVRKDIFRQQGGSQQNFTPYQAVVYGEKQGLFLPSMALSCNIIAALYPLAVRKEADGSYTPLDPQAKSILDQYKNHGAGYGWQAQNTVIDYKEKKIIHYPRDDDFPSNGGNATVNSSRQRVTLDFEKVQGKWPMKKTLENMTLEEGLRHPLVSRFIKQFTGLEDPSVLVEVGQYFQKPAKIWFPTDPVKAENCTDIRAAWLGCNDYGFNLLAYDSLVNYNAARGVRG